MGVTKMPRFTRAVVIRPFSVTHWTCPKSPRDLTHHIDAQGRCTFCRRTQSELRAEQQHILKNEGNRNDGQTH